MVSLYSIFCGCLLISRPEKKLAIALKSFLVLEAIAKVVIIAKVTLTEKGTPLQPRALVYKHVYRYSQWFLVASLRVTHCAEMALALLPSYTSLIGKAIGDRS